ncbi:MAG: NAD(+)/NADH kinase [Planctomycetota bacterium]|nr:MAG: NAD(+)/NADH kinase [Planctomycetota bacterium]REJ92914.1 MAG: NAD(+)/NADH kinase [Planctomycetota bacterium]REK26157.1 MAG: NAD(+)/NADH kinase [Planctomycetota bacterium]REK33526.1 MAG: NAD(+)/NADH kinase [Planctomycetota bacterium]
MAKSDPVRIVVLARQNSARVQTACNELETFLRERPAVELLDVIRDTDDGATAPQADVCIVIGGDGAILRACREYDQQQIPILGVNRGRLGFLADLSPDEFRNQIEAIERREFHVVHHLMLDCEHQRAGGESQRFLVLNEVAVHAGASLSMVDIELEIDGERVTTYSGDGLIISTPVGSTAHNLSAGGPILRQDLQAVVITPVCPHTLTNRPLVDHANCSYVMRLPDAPEGVTLVVDGQIKLPLQSGETIHVKRAEVTFQLARIPGHSYYATLHRKLGWGGQPRYQY